MRLIFAAEGYRRIHEESCPPLYVVVGRAALLSCPRRNQQIVTSCMKEPVAVFLWLVIQLISLQFGISIIRRACIMRNLKSVSPCSGVQRHISIYAHQFLIHEAMAPLLPLNSCPNLVLQFYHTGCGFIYRPRISLRAFRK